MIRMFARATSAGAVRGWLRIVTQIRPVPKALLAELAVREVALPRRVIA